MRASDLRFPSDLSVTDQFCGAGGWSIGARAVGLRLRLAMNHWRRATETYAKNNLDVDVDCADVSAQDPRRYPTTDILITSPECTTHSPAGGNRRKKRVQRDLFMPDVPDPSLVRSRMTMYDVVRFAEYHEYRLILVENVVEVLNWVLFPNWLEAMRILGYEFQIVSLNSMFCWPTPQSRDRVYIVFWRKGNRRPDLRITRPAPCERCGDVEAVQAFKPGRSAGKYGPRRQYLYVCPACAKPVTPYYFAALNAIDFSLPAQRIGDRDKPLMGRTRDRIRYGLDKYGRRVLVVNVKQGERDSSRAWPADTRPIGSVPTWDNYFGLASPFMVRLRGTEDSHIRGSASGLDDPTPTLVSSGQSAALVDPMPFIAMRRGRFLARGADESIPTVTTGEHHLLVQGGAFISLRDADAMHVGPLSDPLKTQTKAPQSALIALSPFLVQYNGTGKASSLDNPVPTQPTADRHGLVSPSRELDVDDCYFRMLQPHEIGAAMAFPRDYVVLGNKREQVKQYGNAVTPPAAAEIVRRAVASLHPEILDN